jgi:hypothetical protein
MKITIDTKEDSHTEIKKVISLLSHLINQPHQTQNIFDTHSSEVQATELPTTETSSLMNMFNQPAQKQTTTEPEQPKEKQPTVQLY